LAFDLFDEEKKGKINMKNFKKAVKEIRENISDNELKTIFEELDNNDNGYITIIEFFKI
jgi:centrin-3